MVFINPLTGGHLCVDSQRNKFRCYNIDRTYGTKIHKEPFSKEHSN
jgi:hypothetical protein